MSMPLSQSLARRAGYRWSEVHMVLPLLLSSGGSWLLLEGSQMSRSPDPNTNHSGRTRSARARSVSVPTPALPPSPSLIRWTVPGLTWAR